MKEINIKKLFNLYNSFKQWQNRQIKKQNTLNLKLVEKFAVTYYTEFSKLPYRLNLLDDLATNENAHSKFLIRLLQHQPALVHFLNYLNENNNNDFFFDTKKISKPYLTFEKMRIDGLIRETNRYAIIIENKIHNAIEQEHQIGRYVEKCNSIGFQTEKIFVLYITRTDKNQTSKQTWGNKYCENDFLTRYSKISYKTHILGWLQNYLTTLTLQEELIKSAIVQYIDHLKHSFNQKQIYSKMNTELKQFLTEELNLTEILSENITIVDDKIKEINLLKMQLEELSKFSKENLFKNWADKLREDFILDDNQIFYQSKDGFIKTGVKLNYEGNFFSVLVEHNFKTTYLGFGRHFTGEYLKSEITEFLEPVKSQESLKREEPWWYGWKYTTFDEGYLEFKHLVKLIINQIETSK